MSLGLKTMQRIFVTGNAGAGKTILATALASDLRLPYIGLDSIVWQPGWLKTPGAERKAKETVVANRAAWVVDGVSDVILNAADTVVFLDYSRLRCFWRVLCRNLPYLFHSRPGLPERCPEILIIPTLVRIIWRFPKNIRPQILEACRIGNKRIVHIRSNRQLEQFVASLGEPHKLIKARPREERAVH
jgi:adenylate kinase family enzyme